MIVLNNDQQDKLVEQFVELQVDSMDIDTLLEFVTDTLIIQYGKLTKEELCLISIALNEYQFNLDNYHLDEMKQVSTKIDTIYKED